jgi:cytochrome c-type biogenesis protein
MEDLLWGIPSAAWFGILTSISPCPLATNITAVSFIGRQVGESRRVLLSGLFYTLGRMLAYMLVAIIVVTSLLSVPEVARSLQTYINYIIGPLLILVGIFLLELIKFRIGKGKSISKGLQERAEKGGIWGALLLGFVFALSFCPVSAGLFFGTLIPLAIKYESNILLPMVYGLGTALPVIVFAFVIAFAVGYVGKLFNQLTKIEYWARRITGVIFILIGIYLIWENIL